MTETALDIAHAQMQADAGDDAARLRFYERLADSELHLLLIAEAAGDQVEPELFDVEGASLVLAFDREERLAQFVGRPAPHVTLVGRALVRMLAEGGLGMALNPDVAPSATVLDPDALVWLVGVLEQGPQDTEARIETFSAPGGLPEVLLGALDTKLATAAGLARMAYLVGVTYEGGARGHMLGLIGAPEAAQGALAAAVNEALVFSGVEAGMLDVAFFAASDPVSAQMAAVGLRFDLPDVVEADAFTPSAPGMDPNKPPKL